jgi:hypothetical protein
VVPFWHNHFDDRYSRRTSIRRNFRLAGEDPTPEIAFGCCRESNGSSLFCLFVPQCFNWFEVGRTVGRVQAEKQTHSGGKDRCEENGIQADHWV